MSEVRQFLEMVTKVASQCRRPPGLNYANMEDFVLQNGREFDLKNAALHPDGEMKECFMNATMLALSHPDMIYCEGYARGAIIPVLHAWCWDNKKKCVVEATWRELGDGYIGVPFKTNWLMPFLLDSGIYGVLDVPQLKWPLLRMTKEELGEITECID